MSKRGFSSPREEALEIAYQTRKDILAGNGDALSILRACLVITTNLGKKTDEEWIRKELFGYSRKDEVPNYRVLSCKYRAGRELSGKFENLHMGLQVSVIMSFLKMKETSTFEDNGKDYVVTVPIMEGILAGIVDRCFFFLTNIITELQYGGIVEYLMEDIRRRTDEKLANLDSKITDETNSLFLNLTSTNPADWSKVGHSCRKILKLIADKVFPPINEKYTVKDGRVLEVQDPNFVNRLCAFVDQKSSGDERKFLMAEAEYWESYLRQAVTYAQMAEHSPSIEKFHADMLAIHTYLIASEILAHVSD